MGLEYTESVEDRLKTLYNNFYKYETKMNEIKKEITIILTKRQLECDHPEFYTDIGYDYIYRMCKSCNKLFNS